MAEIEKLERNTRQLNSDLQAMKSKLIEKGVEVAEGTPTAEYAPKIDEVYEAGRKAQYDEFWDIYQQNGKRKSYSYAFAGYGWIAENFKPKYDIKPTISARYMFSAINHMRGIDIEQIFKDLGITFDTSGVKEIDGFDYFVQYSSPSVLPVISTIGTSQLRYCFYHPADLITIRKLILKDDGSQTFKNIFDGCTKLENLEIEGTIGQNGLNLQWSTKLTHDSLMSIITHLKDFSGTDTWKTITLGAENIAKLTAEELLIMERKQWDYG